MALSDFQLVLIGRTVAARCEILIYMARVQKDEGKKPQCSLRKGLALVKQHEMHEANGKNYSRQCLSVVKMIQRREKLLLQSVEVCGHLACQLLVLLSN